MRESESESEEQRREQEQRRRLRVALGLLQIGGVGFLAVIAAGLAPRLLSAWWPELEGAPWLGVAAGIAAALAAVAFAVARLWRSLRAADRAPPDGGLAPPRR